MYIPLLLSFVLSLHTILIVSHSCSDFIKKYKLQPDSRFTFLYQAKMIHNDVKKVAVSMIDLLLLRLCEVIRELNRKGVLVEQQ